MGIRTHSTYITCRTTITPNRGKIRNEISCSWMTFIAFPVNDRLGEVIIRNPD